MKLVEIHDQPALILETIPEVLTSERAVFGALGPDHYLIDADAAQTRAGEDSDRRLTIPELREAIDWEDTQEPLGYPLIGPEAKLVISSLSHEARQRDDWHQSNAVYMLESIGMRRTARYNQTVSTIRTWLGERLPQMTLSR